MKRVLHLSLLIGLFLFSCAKESAPKVSFYYWKTYCQLSSKEQEVIQTNEVQKLYVRYFDVALQNGVPMPLAPVHFDKKNKPTFIIPVVFIKNEVFLSSKTVEEKLASQILNLVDQINKANKINTQELQIDCDWSLESRDSFLKFMAILKKRSTKTLSVTIRLHQVKYVKETKIPPADYGVLMCYNMGKLEVNGTNSIVDVSIAQKYLGSLKNYPLRLKVALPIFSWWVHERGNSIVQLISKVKREDFKNNSNFEIREHEVLVLQNTLWNGFFFKQGDRLRYEGVSEEQLQEIVALLKLHLPKTPEEVLFYDLDTKNLNNYNDPAFYKTLSATFR